MTTQEFERFNNFLGYGNSVNPKLVFFGLEEGASENDYQDNINYRIDALNGTNVIDLADFHSAEDAPDSMRRWFENQPPETKIQSTWTRYCSLMLAMANLNTDLESRREYQFNALGRTNGETLLVERYPLPRPTHGYWKDDLNVDGLFTSLDGYLNYSIGDEFRAGLLIDMLQQETFCPSAIVIHGANAVRGIMPFLNEIANLNLQPIPLAGLQNPESWNYSIWEKNGKVIKLIFMPFIGGSRGAPINFETINSLGDWIRGY